MGRRPASPASGSCHHATLSSPRFQQRSTRRPSISPGMIEIARGLIAANGLRSLKVRDVAEAADCSIGSVYNEFGDFDGLILTDTIPLRDDARACKKIRQLSVAELLAETIRRISNEDSVSSLFME